ncbi:MAG: flagellar assembly protein FliW [Bacillota bacterium]
MEIETTRFGVIQYREEDVLTFPDGLLGFPNSRRYIIIDVGGSVAFKWMQSLDQPELAFIVVRPGYFRTDYNPHISDDDRKALQLDSQDEIACFAIVSVPRDPERMTANLRGPLVVNLSKRIGRQVVLTDERYTTRHPIIDEYRALASRSVQPTSNAS